MEHAGIFFMIIIVYGLPQGRHNVVIICTLFELDLRSLKISISERSFVCESIVYLPKTICAPVYLL